MRRIAFVALLTGAAVATATAGAVAVDVAARAEQAGAQEENERVVALETDITVQPDGSATFVERIAYSFGSQERHGIVREVVTARDHDDEHERRYPLTELAVESPSGSTPYEVLDRSDGHRRIRIGRIGEPSETITGRHDYQLTYRLGGVVDARPGDDELHWNVTGSGWDVPVDRSAVTVRVPGGATRAGCFVGPKASASACATAGIDDDGVARFEHGYLPSGSGLTIVVAIPDTDGDDVEPQPILGARDGGGFSFSELFGLTPVTVGGVAALLALFGGLAARTRRRRGRSR